MYQILRKTFFWAKSKVSWVLAGSPRVRSMVGHVVLAKPTLLTICYCSPHCHTRVMVAAVIGDVIIHPCLNWTVDTQISTS